MTQDSLSEGVEIKMRTSGRLNNQEKQHSRAIDLTKHWLGVTIEIISRNTGGEYAKTYPDLTNVSMTTATANFITLTEWGIAEAEQITTISVETGEMES